MPDEDVYHATGHVVTIITTSIAVAGIAKTLLLCQIKMHTMSPAMLHTLTAVAGITMILHTAL